MQDPLERQEKSIEFESTVRYLKWSTQSDDFLRFQKNVKFFRSEKWHKVKTAKHIAEYASSFSAATRIVQV